MNRDIDFNQQPESNQDYLQNEATGQAIVIPVIEEQISVGKQMIEAGKVYISKKVSEEEVTVDVPTAYDDHSIERVAINQYIEAAPSVRYEGETIIVPVLREEVVVSKRLMLVEELRITKRQLTNNTTHQVTVRKEEVIVERVPNQNQV